MCSLAESLPQEHGSAAKTPFQDPEPAETECTSNEANRENEDSMRKTSASGDRTPPQTRGDNRRSRDPNIPPIGFNGQMHYQFPMMVPPFEMFPGQYQEMMMDHMMNGGRFRSPYYGFSDFGSPRYENSFQPSATSPGSNSERTDFHPQRDEQTTSSAGNSYNSMSMFGSIIRPELLTDVRGFNDWMKKFAFYLEKINLKDIIPNSFGETKRQPTRAESRHIEHVFNECVSPKYYPPWILKAMDEGLSMPEIITTAFEKITTCGNNFDAIKRLVSFRYDGKYDPRVYINKVKKAIAEWEEDGNILVPMTKAQLLSQGLRGDFMSIHSQLCVGKIEPNINAVDKEILSIYNSKMEHKVTEERTVKCSICHRNDHVAKYCDKRPEQIRDEFRSGRNQYSNKKKEIVSKQTPTRKSWTKNKAKANYANEADREPEIESDADHTDNELRPEPILY